MKAYGGVTSGVAVCGVSAFNFNDSSGVRVPWVFGNLNNGGNAGVAYANGNNTAGNANWNGRPRISIE